MNHQTDPKKMLWYTFMTSVVLQDKRSQTRGPVARERVQCGPRTSEEIKVFKKILSLLAYLKKYYLNCIFFIFKMQPLRQFELDPDPDPLHGTLESP